MKPYHLPSGLGSGLDFLICTDWTPDQALALVELLEDLRDRIWAKIGILKYIRKGVYRCNFFLFVFSTAHELTNDERTG